MRTQIKKISGEESHSSEEKKSLNFEKNVRTLKWQFWEKKLSYRIKVKILTLKQKLSVSAQKSKKKKKVRIPRFMSEFSERRILKKARILGSDLKIPKKKKTIRMLKTEFQHSVSFKVNSEFKYQMSDISGWIIRLK